jgi:CO dehydrogenase maturation factor
MRVAVMGKGGAGKSVVAATLARLLARRGQRVLAVDSDPMPGLAVSLGLGPLTDPMLEEAVERDERGRWRLRKGIGPATAVTRFAAEGPDGVRLLQFGKATKEGFAGSMGSLNALYQVIHRIARTGAPRGWSIVGDLPAGTRQAAFDWAPYAETTLVIVEPSWKSVLAARRIASIVAARGRSGIVAVANKVDDSADERLVREALGDPLVEIPFDPVVKEAERSGIAVLDAHESAATVRAVGRLLELLERA